MTMSSFTATAIALCAVTLLPGAASAQQRLSTSTSPAAVGVLASQQQSNVPPDVKQAENAVEGAVKRFRVGVFGGVALDPELIEFGAHAAFGPFFNENIEFRPGIDVGVGEVTTQFGINLDVLYILPGSTRTTRWSPYVGFGPNFGLSHQAFEAEAEEGEEGADEDGRFNFSDTEFEAGLNFIVGMRSQRGVFFEMRATAYGVSAIRLLAGFNF
jgi:hypothetical protein